MCLFFFYFLDGEIIWAALSWLLLSRLHCCNYSKVQPNVQHLETQKILESGAKCKLPEELINGGKGRVEMQQAERP